MKPTSTPLKIEYSPKKEIYPEGHYEITTCEPHTSTLCAKLDFKDLAGTVLGICNIGPETSPVDPLKNFEAWTYDLRIDNEAREKIGNEKEIEFLELIVNTYNDRVNSAYSSFFSKNRW